MRRTVCMTLLCIAGTAQAQSEIDFDRDIRPILSDRCLFCHGPDANTREADLRLDVEEDAKASVIVPGKPGESELIARITTDDPELRMPPAETKLKLTPEEIDRLRKWVAQGAKWKQHWSFTTPEKPGLPDVQNAEWCRNEIDRFVLRRLEAAKLQHADEASRARLIRRLSFDLTGLPPSLEDVEAFLADDQPGVYERLVDRLLETTSYGERMAADWLDVARYSDTYGYQVDRDRYVWPWRDWVIRSFNSNMAYDRFITEQLAGDLLPNPSEETILATTFNRLHPQKVEGGSTPEEFRIEYVSDRTQTFGTAFLGLTMECCRCHEHKYDPLTQKDYYQFSAFFDNIDEAGLYSYFTSSVPTPTLRLADGGTKTKLAELNRAIQEAEEQLSVVRESRREAFQEWLASKPEPETLIPGRVEHRDFEQGISGGNQSVVGKVGQAVKLSGDDGIGLKVGNFRRFDPFSVSLWMNTPDVKDRAVVFHRSRAWTDAASRGYQLLIEDGRLSFSLIHFWPGNAIRVRTKEPLAVDQWHHVVVTWDGSSRAAGAAIFLNGKPAECDVVRDNLYKNITGGGGDNIAIGQRFRDRGFTDGLVDEFQVFDRQLTSLEVGQLHDASRLADALTAEEKPDGLFDYYLSSADDNYRQALSALRTQREQLCKMQDGLREIMVMQEMPQKRQTWLLRRGAYDARTEKVSAVTPVSLSPFPDGAPRNRLGLAQWLTDPQHPLTARVAVNRFWQSIFGHGLVRTPEDFGRQGERPTHPELLDWLAVDFVEHGWDVKRLLKLIVMSATYRQSSIGSPEASQLDPQNRLLSRSPTYRLPAEMLRDHALAVSGLLVRKVGGAPVRPYEVEVSFKPSKRDKGEGLYRRSVYTYWKRTGPAPVMMTLDASKRDVCRMRRERTSTPLEAFVLMNGPQFVEAARVLSQTILKQSEDDSAALTALFRTLTSRQPNEAEREIVTELFQGQLGYFEADAKRAEAYLKTGDSPPDQSIDAVRLAAMSSVANALMNYDEVLNRR